MVSKQTLGYHPIALPDWKELFQSLADSLENFKANRKQKEGIDVKSRSALIRNYIEDLEYCLFKSNNVIGFYENLVKNYDNLITLMDKPCNQAYAPINRLKDEISMAKKYCPYIEKGVSNE